MVTKDSQFLLGWLGTPVRIIAADEQNLPPMRAMILKEVSSMGVVVEDGAVPRFFPWHEIVEIHPAAVADEQDTGSEEAIDVLLGADTEP